MNIALVLSGGRGERIGNEIPKQYIEVGGKPIIAYCLEVITGHEQIDALQIVADTAWHSMIKNVLRSINAVEKFQGFSIPGKKRQLSILNGLDDIQKYAHGDDVILIHDAARPLLSKLQITACLQGIVGHDGVMPVLPMKDTVYFSEDGRQVSSLLDRSCIFAGQAPEVFRLGKYIAANNALLPERIQSVNGSTEPAILAGMDIAMIPGDENNFKITTPEDLKRFRDLKGKSDESICFGGN